MICDYIILRRAELSLPDLYSERGIYTYRNGVNHAAMIALAVGIALSLLGRVIAPLSFLFDGAWFFATAASLSTYYALMKPRN